jgi:hypothetical protein
LPFRTVRIVRTAYTHGNQVCRLEKSREKRAAGGSSFSEIAPGSRAGEAHFQKSREKRAAAGASFGFAE